MKDKRKLPWKDIGSCAGFIALFLSILTILTLIYIPKWDGLDARLMRNFYAEEENSLDVIMIGSCNSYTSFLPTVAYDEYGMSACVFSGPDQELVTSYHYLIDSLKTQKPKVVALEALFLTCEPTPKREYYNRTAVEYMPPSLNKAKLIMDLGAMESEYMQTVNPSSPGKILTWAGYFFPLLRYHGREDVTMDDVTFHFERDDQVLHHGGSAHYNFIVNDSVDFPEIHNGYEIRDVSREYFIKMRDLCEKEGITFLLVKSPNSWRWDDENTAVVREFAEEQGVPFLDMHTYDDWLVSDYSQSTGRLNVYGMKKFTEHFCEYIQENIPYEPTVLTETAKAHWDDSVATMYKNSNKRDMTLDAGKIYRIINTPAGVSLTWNRVADATSYSVYRAEGSSDQFEKIASVETKNECTYVDKNVEHLKEYNYCVKPDNGSMVGVAANEKSYVFVQAPKNITSKCENGTIKLAWDAVDGIERYRIQRKTHTGLNFEDWETVSWTTYSNLTYKTGSHYNFRVRSVYKVGDKKYYSGSAIVSAMSLPTPKIESVTPDSDSIAISWNKVKKAEGYEIYRQAQDEETFALCGTVGETETTYVDKNVLPGKKYSYKVVATKTSFDYTGRSSASDVYAVTAK